MLKDREELKDIRRKLVDRRNAFLYKRDLFSYDTRDENLDYYIEQLIEELMEELVEPKVA